MDAFERGCALLSAAAYIDGRNRAEPNTTSTRSDAGGSHGYRSDPVSGFEASAFEYEGRIVIAFAGTSLTELSGFAADMFMNDVPLALGFAPEQMRQAAEFYQAIKAAYGSDRVTFTGHSLGGGLAALMGVFFDKPAVVFDTAPFRLAATRENAADLQTYLTSPTKDRLAFAPDSDLAGFTNSEEILLTANPTLFGSLAGALSLAELASRTVRVSDQRAWREPDPGICTAREILSNRLYTLSAQHMSDLRLQSGATEFIEIDSSLLELGPLHRMELHSMSLLAVAAVAPDIAVLTETLPGFLPLLFDHSLYAHKASEASPDFLNRLLQQNRLWDVDWNHSEIRGRPVETLT